MGAKIDWNIWHKRVKDAIAAFQIEDMVAVCNRLNIAFDVDDPISYSGIVELLNEAMEWMIEHYENKWDGKEIPEEDKNKRFNFNYFIDDGGFITIEHHFKKLDDMCEDIEFLDPILHITLSKLKSDDMVELEDEDDTYFSIDFIIASQMW